MFFRGFRRCRAIVVATLFVVANGTAFAQDAAAPQYVREAPEGAPNIVVVLLDDVGFGAASTFGGPAETPTLDALAAQGLRYNRFHTTAICSPTRASLLTGRNPHRTGIGAVMNVADSRRGYDGFHVKDTATIARILLDHGYSTGMFGKWHQTPDWEVSQAGPFDRWPTGEGFEKFYGFQGGETDQFEPTLYRGTDPVARPPGDDYHVTNDIVDEAIRWTRQIDAVRPDKPFFLYLATGGIHAPIQAPAENIARYRGKFDGGWDAMREEIFARQKRLGVIPQDALLTPRHDGLPAWNTLGADEKRLAARLMEAYAGFLSHTDEQIGRLVAELKRDGEFDNTLFIYVVGDNGGSPEGGITGSQNYMGRIQGMPETLEGMLAQMEETGGPSTYPHVSAAWAWATNAPFTWTKSIASHLGGTRNPLVVSWPDGIKRTGEVRSQFGHVNDIAPTILDILGIEAPASVDGIAQQPMDGTSLAYTFADPDAAERHTRQYFEVFGHRAIYDRGWMASAFHERVPWGSGLAVGNKPMEDDTWELYNLDEDYSQAIDLADAHPAKLAEMKALFMEEARRNNLLPLGGVALSKEGMPSLSRSVEKRAYPAGVYSIPESAIPVMTNRSWAIEADLTIAEAARGTIATVGGTAAGWSLFIDDAGRAVFAYRAFAVPSVVLTGPILTAGNHRVRVEFDYDGPGYLKGGDFRLSVDGSKVAEGEVAATPPSFFSINETFDVGRDTGSPSEAYPESAGSEFPFEGGTIGSVVLEQR